MKRDYVSTHLDVSPGEKKQLTPVDETTPFRIALLANFSAGQNRSRKPIRVDIDNFEEILARLHPQLELPGPDDAIRLRFESLDDFLPDAIYANVPLFRELNLRREHLLEAPNTPPPRRPSSAPDTVESALGSGNLLDDILSGVETSSPAHRKPDAWQQTIQDIVSPHVQRGPGQREVGLAEQIQDTTQLAMRMVLHHPDFQDLEAAWRSVDFLLRRLDFGPDLQLYLVDLSKQELLGNAGALSKVLDDGEPWAVIGGLYTFNPDPQELGGLASIAPVAGELGAPFLSSVSPRLMGCDSFAATPDPDDWTEPLAAESEQAWNELRALAGAQWIGLTLPRFLLREPYGRDSVESFRFEEITTPPDPADFLWANPAVACAYLLGESFQQDGWDITLRSTQIAGLPLYTYEADGSTEMIPCAECWMTERTAERFLNRGIMPLASMKHSDAVRLVRLQSIARPAAPLAGRWN